LLKEDAKAAQLVKDSEGLMAKLNSLEERLHNPQAEVFYDILALRGGTKLYSRISMLYSMAIEQDGLPTQGMREVYAEQKKELDGYDAEFKKLVNTDLPALNEAARKMNYPHVIITAAGN
jgi:hypothetical protein